MDISFVFVLEFSISGTSARRFASRTRISRSADFSPLLFCAVAKWPQQNVIANNANADKIIEPIIDSN